MIQKTTDENLVHALWKKTWIKVLTYFLLSCLIIFLFFNKQISNSIIRSYQPVINQNIITSNDKTKFKSDPNSVRKLTLAQITSARINAKDIPIIGQISVPDDGINLPIARGINNKNLAFAAGTFRQDMKMGQGNYALAGHNMSNLGPNLLFSPLYYRAKVGQKIYVTDMRKIYIYQITTKQFISKYRVDLVENTKSKIITLITCDATGNNRLLVRGKYIKKLQYKNAPQNLQRAFNQKFNY